jgi:CheY-like chemotaxis protein
MNAIKFTIEGSVTLTMELEEETEQNMLVKISIADTGIGIEKDKQELIFEEFTQIDSAINRGYAGTGLGLAICKEMLMIQGVELHIESVPGEGSNFWFNQQFAKTEKLEQTVSSKLMELDEAVLSGIFEGKNVLIAEDNPINMMVAEKVINTIAPGLSIRKAVNGQEVLEAYFEDIPDIILMDVNMPIMDGLKAASQIRMLESNTGQKRIPIVAVTAGTLREDLERCKEAGMDTMIAKPYKMEELKLILVQMLRN